VATRRGWSRDPVGRFEFTEGYGLTDEALLFTYGYVELRAKMPGGRGIWRRSAHGGDHSWPPEFDIAEYYGLRSISASGSPRARCGGEVDDALYVSRSRRIWHTTAAMEPPRVDARRRGETELWGTQVPPMVLCCRTMGEFPLGPRRTGRSTIFRTSSRSDYVRSITARGHREVPRPKGKAIGTGDWWIWPPHPPSSTSPPPRGFGKWHCKPARHRYLARPFPGPFNRNNP